MLFNSFEYAIFFPVVYVLYWELAKKNLKLQNILLLLASYFFYACWDFRFLFLLIFSTLLDYYTGLKINDASGTNKRKLWLWLSIIINLGFLGVFKYYNFFITSVGHGLSLFGYHPDLWTLKIILPVGISFYTFHGLSYILDIYYSKIKPERNFIDYSVFVSFFPLLVAGPIERATHLLPQIQTERVFNYLKAVDGIKQILWGLFKKIVIADNCAYFVNLIFSHPSDYAGSTLVLGSVLFAFQIYCDFSGYSDIALGSARLLGIELLRNFAFPYFSRDIAEFWRRWHISLSSWFRDYIYIPLGGNKGGMIRRIRNTFVIFLVSGLWHGANWTFIAWGLIHALYFLPLLLLNSNRVNIEIVARGKYLPTFKELAGMILTFSLVCFAWIFFRAENIVLAFIYVKNMFSYTLFSRPEILPGTLLCILFLFFYYEWLGRENTYALQITTQYKSPLLRISFYYLIVFSMLWFGNFDKNEFIYFQF